MPLQLNESDKFNELNWIRWSNTIRTIAQMRGVCEYLNGIITRPNTLTAEPKDGTAITETS